MLLSDIWYSNAGATWIKAVEPTPFAARAYHSTVVTEGNRIWVIGGSSNADVWYTTDVPF
jgi:hypothetical protein